MPSFLQSLFQLRLIPLVIVSCCLLFTIKVVDIFRGTNEMSRALLVSSAIAEDAQEEEDAAAEEDAADAAPADLVEAAELPKNVSKEPPESVFALKREFSQVEVDILQSLAERRRDLDKWEEEIKLKESLLQATEQRIDDRLNDLNILKGNVEGLLKEYKKHESAEVRSLVKTYEAMKPKDAANIFNELDAPILLTIVDKMSERKAAPILAKMNPLKAKQLTVGLSRNKRLSEGAEKTMEEGG